MDDLALVVDVRPIQAHRFGLADARPAEELGEVRAVVLIHRALPAVLALFDFPTRLANFGDNHFKLLRRRNEADDRFLLRFPNDFGVKRVFRDHRVGHREVEKGACKGSELVASRGPLALADEADPSRDVGVVNTGHEGFHRAGK